MLMKINRCSTVPWLISLLFAVALRTPAQSTNTDFQQAVADYQQSHSQAAAEKVIKMAVAMDQLPPIPEEARKHFVMGQTFIKEAKNTNAFSLASREFIQAARLAPWWPEARYNLAVARQAEGDYANVIVNLKLYQFFKLPGTEAQAVQDKIYALEARQELAAEAAQAEAGEAQKHQRETAAKEVKTEGKLVYWPDDDVLLNMTYSEAKEKIESMKNRHYPIPPGFTSHSYGAWIKNIIISTDKVTWTRNHENPNLWWSATSYYKSMNIRVSFRENWQDYNVFLGVHQEEEHGGQNDTIERDTQFWSALDKDEAVSLADAFYVLKRHAEGYDPAAGKNGPQDSSQ